MIASPLAAAQTCGPDEAAAMRFALAQLPFEPLTGAKWDPVPVESNYDPCATLSSMLVTVEGATGSSPVQALMFHHGEYVGTGTAKARGFTSLDSAASNDDTVVLKYKTPDQPESSVRYQWQGDRVVMLDPAPSSA
ncbi:LppP/LprE family lipoprotein [Mycolicibacterium rutilum]|uniref:LppP/LprE family lipoprotein n=1 Tax=Mycolicibacterium rutilum TaxID=370526 RepID=UPI0012FFB75E|nr:LppP/LprE family lipoprotein [Mycolicibacterium rutilum]